MNHSIETKALLFCFNIVYDIPINAFQDVVVCIIRAMPFWLIVIFICAMPTGPGFFMLAYARLLLRNELNPSYPYRVLHT